MSIIGATGSIGRSAADVAARHSDHLRVVALAARRQWEQVCALARRFDVEAVALCDPEAARCAQRQLAGSGIRVLHGPEGVEEAASWPSADVTLAAPTGVAGLRPVLAALRAGKDVALANKESLVAAGGLVTAAARRHRARLIPVDSEHSAIFQCLQGRPRAQVERLWLTASGGPFRAWRAARIRSAAPAQALEHPTWRMGPRISVDSATLMNKGFEVIEAQWLFRIPARAVRVVVHPQSIVHAFVQFVDGSLLAQCAHPDMRLPIALALAHPARWAQAAVPALDPTALGSLEFEAPDLGRFPCLGLAYAAAEAGGLAPAALNAADEVGVERFLAGELALGDLPLLLEDALAHCAPGGATDLETVLAADAAARARATQWHPRRRRPAAGEQREATP